MESVAMGVDQAIHGRIVDRRDERPFGRGDVGPDEQHPPIGHDRGLRALAQRVPLRVFRIWAKP